MRLFLAALLLSALPASADGPWINLTTKPQSFNFTTKAECVRIHTTFGPMTAPADVVITLNGKTVKGRATSSFGVVTQAAPKVQAFAIFASANTTVAVFRKEFPMTVTVNRRTGVVTKSCAGA